MKQHKDSAVVLTRIDYSERDRILTLLCKNMGKVSVLAKGVRAEKSRLSGGIELLSESDVSFIEGRSDLHTLTGARLRIHYGKITKDMRKMQQAFSFLKSINTLTEERSGQEYYDTLVVGLAGLDDESMNSLIVEMWFNMQILQYFGSSPNLDVLDSPEERFEFSYDAQQFMPKPAGPFTKNDLKLLRLCQRGNRPPKIATELGSEDRLLSLTQILLKSNVTEV